MRATMILLAVSAIALFCWEAPLPTPARPIEDSMESQVSLESCRQNPDRLYDREKVLRQLADVLNDSVPRYERTTGDRFELKYGLPWRFFVFDLVDLSNKITPSDGGCIKFLDKHVYHFAPEDFAYSLSHILVLEKGKLTIFKSVNCGDEAQNLKAVTNYVRERLQLGEGDNVVQRLKNYRRHGLYRLVDIAEILCDQTK